MDLVDAAGDHFQGGRSALASASPGLPDRPEFPKGTARDAALQPCADHCAAGQVKVGGQLPDKPNHPLEKTRGHEQGLAVGI